MADFQNTRKNMYVFKTLHSYEKELKTVLIKIARLSQFVFFMNFFCSQVKLFIFTKEIL